jgi:hypothetical protein
VPAPGMGVSSTILKDLNGIIHFPDPSGGRRLHQAVISTSTQNYPMIKLSFLSNELTLSGYVIMVTAIYVF